MGTFATQSLGLGHTLPTILNKSGSRVSYPTGVQSELLLLLLAASLTCAYVRCDAHRSNLDGPDSHQCSHEKTDLYIKSYDQRVLWDDFGIRHNIVVCTTLRFDALFDEALHSRSHIHFRVQTFTSCSHQIYFTN